MLRLKQKRLKKPWGFAVISIKKRNMDSDTFSIRLDINKIAGVIRSKEPNCSNAYELSESMVRLFEREINSLARDFEKGEGDFSSCYLEAKRMSE